mmetsp:Transcript_56314/g.157950  ORF Transcript_56314/g.157950 Transcript_56314/m.157950 type:complete len:369 (-) Transcript_56314:23-1129(-)
MAGQGPLIVQTREGLEVRGRRRLGDPGAFAGLLEDLSRRLAAGEGAEPLVIADLDVSQNPLTGEQFESLFTQLGSHHARVLRFRMFGCPTLNDDVARVIADYFRLLTPERAPTEMHLSDCAITAEGFGHIMSAFEETEVYPAPIMKGGRPMALYMRLENNYIDEAAIQEKVDAGVIAAYRKGSGSRVPSIGAKKVDLIVRENGRFMQKQGDPPAPEHAPPPKDVNDRYSQMQTSRTPNASEQVRMALPGGPRVGHAWIAQTWVQPGFQWPGMWHVAGHWAGHWPGQRVVRPSATAGPGALVVAGSGAVKSGVVTPTVSKRSEPQARDRSRTPAKPELPHPWEEHWSEEYQIPYYWNSETGDALWEKPV